MYRSLSSIYIEWQGCGKVFRKFAIMLLWILIYSEWRCCSKVCRKFAIMPFLNIHWTKLSIYGVAMLRQSVPSVCQNASMNIHLSLPSIYTEWRCFGKVCRKFARMLLWIFISLYLPYTEWRCYGNVCRRFAKRFPWILMNWYTEWRCYGNVCRRFAKRFPWILMNWLVCHSIAKKQIWSVTECRSFASG